jgi:transposase
MRNDSGDLRNKIVAAMERGMSKAQAIRLFDVSLSSGKRYSRIAYQGESLRPRKCPGRSCEVDEKAQGPSRNLPVLMTSALEDPHFLT